MTAKIQSASQICIRVAYPSLGICKGKRRNRSAKSHTFLLWSLEDFEIEIRDKRRFPSKEDSDFEDGISSILVLLASMYNTRLPMKALVACIRRLLMLRLFSTSIGPEPCQSFRPISIHNLYQYMVISSFLNTELAISCPFSEISLRA